MNMQLRAGELAKAWNGLPDAFTSGAMMALPKAQLRSWLELTSLASQRSRAYMDIPGTLSRCRSVQDIAREQARFWEVAAGQYNHTAKAIFGIWTGLMAAAGEASRAAVPVPRDLITFPEAAPAPAPRSSGREAA